MIVNVGHLTAIYRAKLEELGYGRRSVKADNNFIAPPVEFQFEHLYWMLGEIDKNVQSPHAHVDLAKANRWLGFVQGVLWSRGIYSINELRQHVDPSIVIEKLNKLGDG